MDAEGGGVTEDWALAFGGVVDVVQGLGRVLRHGDEHPAEHPAEALLHELELGAVGGHHPA